ncbi:MAG: hypothetical protein HQ528_05650 [Candidatus Marinimicrobia bacterium]|nr:hypothetical protein [Candidatus Neomarinimicrobiota bacterium]
MIVGRWKANYYFGALKYAQKAGAEGFDWDDMVKDLKLTNSQANNINAYAYQNSMSPILDRNIESDKWILAIEGEKLLLEYDELEHARKSSRNAIFIACGAMLINIIVSGFMISFSKSDGKNISEMNTTISDIHDVIEDYDKDLIVSNLK